MRRYSIYLENGSDMEVEAASPDAAVAEILAEDPTADVGAIADITNPNDPLAVLPDGTLKRPSAEFAAEVARVILRLARGE